MGEGQLPTDETWPALLLFDLGELASDALPWHGDTHDPIANQMGINSTGAGDSPKVGNLKEVKKHILLPFSCYKFSGFNRVGNCTSSFSIKKKQYVAGMK